MKITKKIAALILSFVLIFVISACEKMDEDYGKNPDAGKDSAASELSYPEIKSSDTVMSKYFDISLFDEENYSTSYLGKKFKFKATYSGSEINLPTTYSNLLKDGWSIWEESEYKEDSSLLAGKTAEVKLINGFNNAINAVFYNSSKYSKKLSKCDVVKFIIPENCLDVKNSEYGYFWINGVVNSSAINNIVEYWGIPSHFYAVNDEHYYLDYFFTRDSKRNGMTVHVNPADDSVISIEFSSYK